MLVTSRPALPGDLGVLVALYRDLEKEQAALRPMWPLADGLAEPVEDSLGALLDDPESVVRVGEIDGVVLGFVHARAEGLLPQAGGRRVGTFYLVFTDHEARGVGIGTTMVTAAMDDLRSRGIEIFDARVSPGHRNAKNFFEAHGFSARLIVMHRSGDTA
jgi:ribosomal protein S18 acetylase RimI-like enzyme